MSTRANIKMVDASGSELWFYRHSDGYPSGTMPTLKKFLELVKTEKIRDNVSQAGGWLIIIGHEEYAEDNVKYPDICGWKVGAYEPTTGEHGDIEYLYTIDLAKKTIKTKKLYR
jgi:hypothetical protein